jgi:hypothetical protein
VNALLEVEPSRIVANGLLVCSSAICLVDTLQQRPETGLERPILAGAEDVPHEQQGDHAVAAKVSQEAPRTREDLVRIGHEGQTLRPVRVLGNQVVGGLGERLLGAELLQLGEVEGGVEGVHAGVEVEDVAIVPADGAALLGRGKRERGGGDVVEPQATQDETAIIRLGDLNRILDEGLQNARALGEVADRPHASKDGEGQRGRGVEGELAADADGRVLVVA